MLHVNEAAKIIPLNVNLRTEIRLIKKHIHPDSVVLELGARYGRTSCAINSILNNPLNQLSVEPDSSVHSCLESNMVINNCNFYILKGAISTAPMELIKLKDGPVISLNPNSVVANPAEEIKLNKIDKSFSKKAVKTYSLEQVEEMYNLSFNTLVANCNGALEKFLNENPNLYTQLTTVIFNKSLPKKCDYVKIAEALTTNNFKQIVVKGTYEVWKKD